jgi:hypothetical protein
VDGSSQDIRHLQTANCWQFAYGTLLDSHFDDGMAIAQEQIACQKIFAMCKEFFLQNANRTPKANFVPTKEGLRPHVSVCLLNFPKMRDQFF